MRDGILKNLDVSYIGYDIYEDLISFHAKNNSNNNRKFIKLDIFNDRENIENSDLLICKDVLQHWDDESVVNFISWLTCSKKFQYILITNCRSEFGFSTVGTTGGWRGLDDQHPLFINKQFVRILTYNTKAVLLWSR